MAAFQLALCLIFVTESLAQCGVQFATQQRILNGAPAIPCSIPWHAQVHITLDNTIPTVNNETITCGATILDTQHVAVSPTCLFLYNENVAAILSSVLIVAGDNDVAIFPETSFLGTQQEQIRRPIEVYFQDEYTIRTRPTLFGNINPGANDYKAFRDHQCAVMKLDTPFTFNRCINSICLPTQDDINNSCNDRNCLFAGNGLITDDLTATTLRATVTQVAKLQPLPGDTCNLLEAMGYSLPITGGLCARPTSTGVPCVNDNGGGLACRREDGSYYLRGIAVPDFCTTGGASLFADVPTCVDFFTEVMAGTRTPATP